VAGSSWWREVPRDGAISEGTERGISGDDAGDAFGAEDADAPSVLWAVAPDGPAHDSPKKGWACTLLFVTWTSATNGLVRLGHTLAHAARFRSLFRQRYSYR
jgi:hypothetical protein